MELDTAGVSTLARLGLLFITLPRSPPSGLGCQGLTSVVPSLAHPRVCSMGPAPPRPTLLESTPPARGCPRLSVSHSQSTLSRILPHHAVDRQVRIHQAVVEPTRPRSPGDVEVLCQEGGSRHAHRLLHPTSRPQLPHAWWDKGDTAGGQATQKATADRQAVSDIGS